MPLPEHAPAARPISGKAVMSWQRLDSAVRWVPGPWSPPRHRPASAPVSASRNTAGRLTMPASSGARQGNADDVDAEQRGVRVLAGQLVRAARELVPRAHGRRAGAVHVDVAGLVPVGHHRVGVRAAAGLHRGDLPRPPQVADVEDPDAAEALRADGIGDALEPAVEAPPRLLDRHDQQVADHRHVALAAGADDGGYQPGRCRRLDPVGVEPVVAADEQPVPGERQIGDPEAEQASPLRVFLFLLLFLLRRLLGLGVARLRLRLGFHRHAPARRTVGVEEARGLRARRHQGHVRGRLPGVLEAGREPHPGVGRELGEHRVHPIDLRGLVGRDVGREREELRVLRRPALLEQILHHRDGAPVVLDHPLEEEPVERAPGRRRELRHLAGGQHAGHRLPAVGVVRVDLRDRLPAGPQPRLHHLDLVVLRELDALRQAPHGLAGSPLGDERGHLERLRVMRNHPLHEPDVAVREPDPGEIGGLGDRDLPARLARRAGLHDGRLRVADRRPEGEQRRADRGDQDEGCRAGVIESHEHLREAGSGAQVLPLHSTGPGARRPLTAGIAVARGSGRRPTDPAGARAVWRRGRPDSHCPPSSGSPGVPSGSWAPSEFWNIESCV